MAILPIADGWEFYGEPDLQSPVDDDVASLEDFSGNNRDLTAGISHPIFKTNILNGHSVVRFNKTSPLENTETINIKSGFIVSNFVDPSFPKYAGLLSGRATADVLTGNFEGVNFFDFAHPKFEFRSNHRIYLQSASPAPMGGEFHIIFFKFWLGNLLDGVQLGQQRTFTSRTWDGDVAFLALTNRNLHEEEIHDYTIKIAEHFDLELPSVYPYQADYNGHAEEPEQDINLYDPPEGARITEVVSPSKDSFELQFSGADSEEVDVFKAFYKTHYEAGLPFIYRDYRFGIPRDFEGYFDSPPQITGQRGEFAYAFKMRQI